MRLSLLLYHMLLVAIELVTSAHLREHPLFNDIGTCVRCLDYLDPDTSLAEKASQGIPRKFIHTGWERDCDDAKEVRHELPGLLVF